MKKEFRHHYLKQRRLDATRFCNMGSVFERVKNAMVSFRHMDASGTLWTSSPSHLILLLCSHWFDLVG